MNEQTYQPLVDRMVDAYVAWREESLGVWETYATWASADRADRPRAFSVYRAALEREEHASRVYEDSIIRVTSAGKGPSRFPLSQLDGHETEPALARGFAKLVALSPGFARIVGFAE